MRAALMTDLPYVPDELEGLPVPALFTVDEVMAREVLAVHPDTSLQTAAELMLEHGISGMPVVDDEGQLVGMVSKTDMLRHQFEDSEVSVGTLPSGQHLLEDTIVEEVMTPQVLAVREGASLVDAAKILVEAGLHRVPVITRTGALAGLISTSDIVRWVAGLP
ncbi:MAG TPA: CBS domain-containing protein [Archangium sp.]|jgi:CBS domain-containing protein|uniref:CBS domain-containing protein n=1 Tax=Archangium sp. TaxID=1872627 RepID=UPI002ED862F0